MKKKVSVHVPGRNFPSAAQILMKMKLTLFVLMLSFFGAIASDSYAQTKLSLDLKNTTVRDALDAIENQSEFFFLYSEKLIDVNRKIEVLAQQSTVDKVLDKIFDGTDVNYTVKDRQIVLTIPDSNFSNEITSGTQQNKKISGKVTDSSGSTLPGVSVILKGTTTGVITDNEGNYSLQNIPGNGILQFSFVGMKTQEVAVGEKNSINIVMVEETIGVDEVVVTALGIKRNEKALGYSVQAVKGDVLQTVKGIDMSTSLTGKVAGLQINNSTEFTAESTILLRGESPLLVLDGVPYANMKLRDIPADDIESISVLKGATASALYGSRGGAGAIMITSKRGMAKSGLSINVNSGTMFNAGFVAVPELQSKFGRDFATRSDGKYEILRNFSGSWGRPIEGQMVYQWDPVQKTMVESPYLNYGDNFKNFLEQGFIANNNINVTQQGELGSFRTSGTWVKNKGQYPNSMFDKITFSVGGDMKFKKFSLSSNVSYNKQVTPNKGFGGYTGYDPMYGLIIQGANDYDVRAYKDYWLIPNEVQNNSYTATVNNPYFDRYERTFGFNRDIFNGNITLNYQFTPWLKGLFRSGYDTYSVRSEMILSKGNFQGGGNGNIGGNEVWGESLKGSYNVGIDRGYSISNECIMMFNKSFDKLVVDALAGVSSNFKRDETVWGFTKGGLSIPGYYSLLSSISPVFAGSKLWQKQTNSVYGKLGVSWRNLLFADATFRNDWVSTLPEATRSYFYPSVSGSFLASEFLKDYKWLSLWKLRASWTTVKIPADIYTINTVLSVTNPAWGSLASASAPTTIRPVDLIPQSTATTEFGTVINVLQNRISFDATYYMKRGYDYIKSATVSATSGYASIFMNTKEERTRKGLELMLNMIPVKTKDVKWSVLLNWSKEAEYYTKVDPLYTTNVDKPWIGVGKRADSFTTQQNLKDPGGNIIHLNGIPQYSTFQSLYGYSRPDWMFGIGSNLTYKNFTFAISMDGRVGGLLSSWTSMYLWNAGSHPESITEPARYLDATVSGSKNYIGTGVKVASGSVKFDAIGNIIDDTRTFAPNDVAVTYKQYTQTMHKSIAWGGNASPGDIFSGTFMKLREISLTYDIPTSITSKVRMKGASISAVAQNVFMWAKDFKYSDPDGGSENLADPSQRYVGFNLKLDF